MSSPRKPYHTDAEYQKLAEEAVSRYAPGARAGASFAYYGDLALGKTWAHTFGKTRDSGLLEQSNFDVIYGDLKKQFPDDVEIERSSHWAVGWTDQIAVRMLNNEGRVTEAGKRVLDWKAKLEDYPVADEDHYSDLEAQETFDNVARTLKYIGLDDRQAKRLVRKVIAWFYENDPSQIENHDDQGGDPGDAAVKDAVKAMGYYKTDDGWVLELGLFDEPVD